MATNANTSSSVNKCCMFNWKILHLVLPLGTYEDTAPPVLVAFSAQTHLSVILGFPSLPQTVNKICNFWNYIYIKHSENTTYRLMTAYLLLRVILEKMLAHWGFAASSARNPKGECTGQASKSKRKYIILSKFSSTK